jgi:hypothetical protein
VVELAQLVEGYELEPFEADLKSIRRELSGCRGRIQELTKSYVQVKERKNTRGGSTERDKRERTRRS